MLRLGCIFILQDEGFLFLKPWVWAVQMFQMQSPLFEPRRISWRQCRIRITTGFYSFSKRHFLVWSAFYHKESWREITDLNETLGMLKVCFSRSRASTKWAGLWHSFLQQINALINLHSRSLLIREFNINTLLLLFPPLPNTETLRSWQLNFWFLQTFGERVVWSVWWN